MCVESSEAGDDGDERGMTGMREGCEGWFRDARDEMSENEMRMSSVMDLVRRTAENAHLSCAMLCSARW